ncbi:MAG: hypothetical protein R6W83_00875 [Cryobacterium sp.]
MPAQLRTWPAQRRLIAAGVFAGVLTVLTVASGSVSLTGSGAAFSGTWWSYAVMVVGAGLIGLIVAGYINAPIGGQATRCDVRWPVLGLLALYFTTEVREAVPLIAQSARPVVAVAALVLLVWALLERLASEHRAVSESDQGGEVCTTCKPLFPATPRRSSGVSADD